MATQEALPLEVGIVPVELKPRPAVLNGRTYKVGTPMGTAFVSINENPTGDIFEVFIHLGRAGSDLMADAEAIGRLITLAFRIPSDYTSASPKTWSISYRASAAAARPASARNEFARWPTPWRAPSPNTRPAKRPRSRAR